jgi:MEMO1 family protein
VGAAYYLTHQVRHMSFDVREPAVAGRFYPGTPEELTAEIRSYTAVTTDEKLPAIGCVVPHAGYMYSGHVAGAVYQRLDLPKHFVILCPNHTGAGHPLALMDTGAWRTPLGEAQIDHDLAESLLGFFPLLEVDDEAHRAEHALEVQLPFLQALAGDFRFVPIAVGTGRLQVLKALGESMARAIEASGKRVMIIASSDMNHYESDVETRAKDRLAINRLLALDPQGLFDVVQQQKISMCGYGPAVAMLTAARRLGASRAELIKYATSGDVSGDRDRVVGYAGIAVI